MARASATSGRSCPAVHGFFEAHVLGSEEPPYRSVADAQAASFVLRTDLFQRQIGNRLDPPPAAKPARPSSESCDRRPLAWPRRYRGQTRTQLITAAERSILSHTLVPDRSDFIFDPEQDQYTCPAGKLLKQYHRNFSLPRTDNAHDGIRKYRAAQRDCQGCELKARCCPNMPARNVLRSIHEDARDRARQLAGTPDFERSCNERKKVEMLFAHLKTTLRFERMRLRGLSGARDEFLLAAITQNLRRMARLTPPPAAMPA